MRLTVIQKIDRWIKVYKNIVPKMLDKSARSLTST